MEENLGNSFARFYTINHFFTVSFFVAGPVSKSMFCSFNKAEVYDPAFLLCILFNLLDPENLIDVQEMISSKIVSFMFQCLSSHCYNIRHLACHCLLLYQDHVIGQCNLVIEKFAVQNKTLV